MIEAVNSAIAATPFLRALPGMGAEISQPLANQGAEHVIETIGSAKGPQAPFISPYVYVNLNYNKAVLQIRDGETGDVLDQIPSDERLAAQQRSFTTEEHAVMQAREFFVDNTQTETTQTTHVSQHSAAPKEPSYDSGIGESDKKTTDGDTTSGKNVDVLA